MKIVGSVVFKQKYSLVLLKKVFFVLLHWIHSIILNKCFLLLQVSFTADQCRQRVA